MEQGPATEKILEVAIGRRPNRSWVRGAAGHMGAATHLVRPTAHRVVTQAECPVSGVSLAKSLGNQLKLSLRRSEQVNAQVERFFGYSHSELLGKPFEILLAATHVQFPTARHTK